MSGWLANRPAGSNIAAAWHSYPSANPSLTSECAAQACWDSVVAPIAAKVPVVTGETGDSVAGPETYLPSFLPWAGSHGISVVAWTWNAWTNPDDVLVTSMTGGSPTPGEGVTYRAWLAALPVPSPAPTGTTYSPPPAPAPAPAPAAAPAPAPTSAPVQPTAPGHPAGAPVPVKASPKGAPTAAGHKTEPPKKVTSGPQDPVKQRNDPRIAAPIPLSAADAFALRTIYLGFAFIGLAAALWAAAHIATFMAAFAHSSLRAARPI